MFNIEISGNLKFHLQTIRKRIKTDKCVELRIPDHLILEDALAVNLQEGGITEIREPAMKIYLRPRIMANVASVTIGIFCDLWNGGIGDGASYFMASLDMLKFDIQGIQLKNELKKTLIIPCVISASHAQWTGTNSTGSLGFHHGPREVNISICQTGSLRTHGSTCTLKLCQPQNS